VGPQTFTVGGDDAATLLAAVLQGIEPQIGQVGRLGVTVDPEDAAFLMEFIEHEIE
jgi:hypothetical protein